MQMSEEDYGYFGSGDEGYAHYITETGDKEDLNGTGGGPRGKRPNPGSKGPIGCLVVLGILAILSMLAQS